MHIWGGGNRVWGFVSGRLDRFLENKLDVEDGNWIRDCKCAACQINK